MKTAGQGEAAEAESAAPQPDAAASAAYGQLMGALREFLDRVAAARPPAAAAAALAQDLRAWSRTLAPLAVGEREQLWSRQHRGTMTPNLLIQHADRDAIRGVVCLGRYFLGGGGAAHGGVIPLLFDDLMGRLANSGGRPMARVVYLKTDYRSVTPIGPELAVAAWFDREDGRKRLLRAELRHGDTLCAEAESLFIQLRPGQAWTELMG